MIDRREMLAGAGALAAGGPAFLFPDRARAAGRTLKIIQWSHFVPAWDTWFNGTYVKDWAVKNDTNVIVDNINLVDLGARAASEASAALLRVYSLREAEARASTDALMASWSAPAASVQ